MKKSNLLVQKLIVALLVLSIVSCGKNGVTAIDTQKCEAKAKAVADATTLYTSSPTQANCQALKNVLQNYVNEGGGCGVSASDLTAARSMIENLTCP
jgi:hypothetical protein